MNKLMSDMPLFVEVAKQKSFSRAADVLDMPTSTLSRRIAALEKNLGAPLFLRNSRNVELTESGKAFYTRCEFIVAEAELACENLRHDMQSPAGKVRIALRADAYHITLADFLMLFAEKWPDIHLQIYLSDRRVDLLTEPFDLELHVGPLEDSNLIVRRLGQVEPSLYVSPKLLGGRPVPLEPEDLRDLPCVMLPNIGETWELHKGDEVRKVRVKGAYTTNHMSVARDFALRGLAMSWLARPMVIQHEERGELVRLIPEWTNIEVDVSILMANNQLPRRVRLLVDHLVEYSQQFRKK